MPGPAVKAAGYGPYCASYSRNCKPFVDPRASAGIENLVGVFAPFFPSPPSPTFQKYSGVRKRSNRRRLNHAQFRRCGNSKQYRRLQVFSSVLSNQVENLPYPAWENFAVWHNFPLGVRQTQVPSLCRLYFISALCFIVSCSTNIPTPALVNDRNGFSGFSAEIAFSLLDKIRNRLSCTRTF